MFEGGTTAAPAPLKTTRTTFVPDAYGNVDDETVSISTGGSVSGGFLTGDELLEQSRTRVTEREIHVSSWQLTNPKRIEIENSKYNEGGLVDTAKRISGFEYYPNGLLRKAIREPEDIHDLRLTVELVRDPTTNNVQTVRTHGNGTQTRIDETAYDSRGLFPVLIKRGATSTQPATLDTEVLYDDGTGAPLVVVDPNGRVTRMAYDPFGRTRSVEEPTHTTSVQYGQAWAEEGVPFVDLVWGALKVTTSIPSNGTVEETFDAFGRTVRTRTRGMGGVWVDEDTLYDWIGRPIRRSLPHVPHDASQGGTQYQYDLMGRLTKETAPDGREALFEYPSKNTVLPELADAFGGRFDLVGAVERRMNGLVRFTVGTHQGTPSSITEFDLAEGPVSFPVEGEGTARTEYTYRSFGRLDSVKDPDGLLTSFDLDLLGRRLGIVDASAGARATVYNAFGEVAEETDGEGDTTCFEYDGLGRLRRVSQPSAEPFGCQDSTFTIASWTYGTSTANNENGRLVSEFRRAGPDLPNETGTTTVYGYQPRSPSGPNPGLLESVTRRIPGVDELITSFEYDGPRVSRIRYPAPSNHDAFDAHYQYDDEGILESVDDGLGNPYWKRLAWEQGSRVTQELLGNGVTSNFDYVDLESCPNEACVPGALRKITRTAGNHLETLTYRYDVSGRPSSRLTQRGAFDGLHSADELSETFVHDAFGRITRHVATKYTVPTSIGITTNYAYSPGGDILTTSVGSFSIESYNYELGSHRVASRSTNEYTYDDNGSMLTRPGPTGLQTFHYERSQLPWMIETAGSGQTRLEYDAAEQRVAKRGPTSTTIYAGDLYECTGATPTASGQPFSCNEHRYKVFAGGALVAQLTRSSAGGVANAVFVSEDPLGSTSLLTDNQGGVVEARSFEPFGRSRTDLSASSVRAAFTGHEADVDLGLINMRGRLYDPDLRRFTSADPLANPASTQGMNRYSYVGNSPLAATDPSGFQQAPPPQFSPPPVVFPRDGYWQHVPPTFSEGQSRWRFHPIAPPPKSSGGAAAAAPEQSGPEATDFDPAAAAVSAEQRAAQSRYEAKSNSYLNSVASNSGASSPGNGVAGGHGSFGGPASGGQPTLSTPTFVPSAGAWLGGHSGAYAGTIPHFYPLYGGSGRPPAPTFKEWISHGEYPGSSCLQSDRCLGQLQQGFLDGSELVLTMAAFEVALPYVALGVEAILAGAVARGARTVAMTTTEAAQVLKTAPGNFPSMPAFGRAVGWGRNGGEAAFARAGSITKAEAQALGISADEAFAIRDAYRAVINSSKGAANPTALGREALMNRVGHLLQ